MKENKPSTYLLWNANEDDYSVALYKELLSASWNPDNIFIPNDKKTWISFDLGVREDSLKSLITSKTVEQKIGTKLMPILIKVVGDEFVTRRAMLSLIAARLNGDHSYIASKFIEDLNPQSLINKCFDELESNDEMQVYVSMIDVLFENVDAWADAYKFFDETADKRTFDELNLALWKACSIASVLLETAQSTITMILFEQDNVKSIETLLEFSRVTLKDRTIISSYLALIARSKFMSLPQDYKEEAIRWTEHTVKFIFANYWKEIYNLAHNETIRENAERYGYYNINKALWKLDIEPLFPVSEMPEIVKEKLKVVEKVENIERRPFWKW